MLSRVVLSSPGPAVHVLFQGELTYADLPVLKQFGRSCLEQGANEAWLQDWIAQDPPRA